jgi:hypothetical protein
MKNTIVESIISGNLDNAKRLVEAQLARASLVSLERARARIAMSEAFRRKSAVRRMGRLNFVRVRVRRGKVQRRKKVSAVKGWTLRGGRLQRMRPSERLRRRLGARRAKLKRRSKKAQIRRRTAFAMRKRRSLGLSYKPFGR